MKTLQQYIVRNLILIMVISTMISGCKKESVEPDKMDDKKDDKPVLLSDIQKIEGGGFHTMLLKTDSTLWATGKNEQGQLGTGDNTARFTFKKVMTDVVDVACGYSHTLVLKSDGSLWVTGDNEKGQLGTGNNININAFEKVLEDIKSIDAGYAHSMALKKNNILVVAGENSEGQLGLNNNDNYNTFVGVKEAKSIAAGIRHSFLIDENDDLWATGINNRGQLGSFNFESQTIFKKVASGIAEINSGFTYSMAMTKAGTFMDSGIGFNPLREPGKSVLSENTEFDVTDFASGMLHYLVVSDSSLWGIGENINGQLGITDTGSIEFSLLVDGNVSCVFAGYLNTWYIDAEGKLWATGANEHGQLGIGDSENRSQFTLIKL